MSEKPARRFRPWPKKFDGVRNVIDKEKLHQQYLDGAKYAWRDFCETKNYDPHPQKKQDFPVRVWQAEWIAHKVRESQEDAMDAVLDLKKYVQEERLKLPRTFNEMANVFRTLGTVIINQDLADARWDQEHAEFLKSNPEQRRFKMPPAKLSLMVNAQKRVMEMQQEALLIVRATAYQDVLPLKDPDPEETEAMAEGERLNSMGTTLIGAPTLSQKDVAAMMTEFVDQYRDAEQVAKTEIEVSNAPLTPFEGDDDSE